MVFLMDGMCLMACKPSDCIKKCTVNTWSMLQCLSSASSFISVASKVSTHRFRNVTVSLGPHHCLSTMCTSIHDVDPTTVQHVVGRTGVSSISSQLVTSMMLKELSRSASRRLRMSRRSVKMHLMFLSSLKYVEADRCH